MCVLEGYEDPGHLLVAFIVVIVIFLFLERHTAHIEYNTLVCTWMYAYFIFLGLEVEDGCLAGVSHELAQVAAPPGKVESVL